MSSQIGNLAGQEMVPVLQMLTAWPTRRVIEYGLSTAGGSWAAMGVAMIARRRATGAMFRKVSTTFRFMLFLKLNERYRKCQLFFDCAELSAKSFTIL